MMWRDSIELGSMTEVVTLGEAIQSVVYRTVFANKKSVRSKEWYEARLLGLKPELMFEIRSSEYDDETKVRFNNKVYEVVRTYDDGEFTELIVTRGLDG